MWFSCIPYLIFVTVRNDKVPLFFAKKIVPDHYALRQDQPSKITRSRCKMFYHSESADAKEYQRIVSEAEEERRQDGCLL